jgi:hypothetical protein
MAAKAYARSTAKFNDFKRDGIFRNHNQTPAFFIKSVPQ